MEDPSLQYGLNIAGPVGTGVSTQEQIHQQWDTFSQVEQRLTEMGFPPMERPAFGIPPVTPELLSNASSHEFSTTYQQIVAWYSYINNTHARTKAMLRQVQNELKILEAHSRKEFRKMKKELKLTDRQIEDEIILLPRHQQLRYQEQWLLQEKDAIESYLEAVDGTRKLISRQVEIRRQELEGLGGGPRAYGQPGMFPR